MAQQRVSEAKKLGFSTCILPKVCVPGLTDTSGIQIVGVGNIREAIQKG